MMTRMLVCGDRKWLKHYLPDGTIDAVKVRSIRRGSYRILDMMARKMNADTLIEGCADGADRLAERWTFAQETLGPDLIKQHLHFPALWDKHGRSAGPIRNIQMMDEGKPDFVVALHDNLSDSKGTKHMVSIADKAGIPVYGFFSDDALEADLAYG